MGEAAGLARSLMVLGAVFLLVGLLYPGADAPWNAFVVTLSGQTFPTFVNPFAVRLEQNFTLTPDADNDADAPATSTDEFDTESVGTDRSACDTTSTPEDVGSFYWGCLTHVGTFGGNTQLNPLEPDANQTRVTILAGDPTFEVSLSTLPGGVPGDNLISYVDVYYQCTSGSTGGVRPNFAFENSGGTSLPIGGIGEFLDCGSGYKTNRIRFLGQVTGLTNSDLSNGFIRVESGGSPAGIIGTLQVSYLSVVVTYSPAKECVDIGCYLDQFAQFLIDFLVLIFNGIVFIVEVIFFVGQLVLSFFTGIFGTLAFLFALPGAPLIVQGIIDVLLVGLIGYVVYALLKLLPFSG